MSPRKHSPGAHLPAFSQIDAPSPHGCSTPSDGSKSQGCGSPWPSEGSSTNSGGRSRSNSVVSRLDDASVSSPSRPPSPFSSGSPLAGLTTTLLVGGEQEQAEELSPQVEESDGLEEHARVEADEEQAEEEGRPTEQHEDVQREDEAAVTYARLLEEHVHAMDAAGAPDELLSLWAEEEARLLSPQPAPPTATTPPEGPGPPASPASAEGEQVTLENRARCLFGLRAELMQALDTQFDMEVWFEAVAIFDAYIRGSRCRVAELPTVCAVLVRLVWKHEYSGYISPIVAEVEARFRTLLQGGGTLAQSQGGGASSTEQSAEGYVLAELKVLRTLRGKLRLPSLAKWSKAFFARLEYSLGQDRRSQVAAARERCMKLVERFTLLQAYSHQRPPQRLARGLLVLLASRGGLEPAPLRNPVEQLRRGLPGAMTDNANNYLSPFERVVGAAPDELLADVRLALQAVQFVGLDPSDPSVFGPPAEPLALALDHRDEQDEED